MEQVKEHIEWEMFGFTLDQQFPNITGSLCDFPFLAFSFATPSHFSRHKMLQLWATGNEGEAELGRVI